jgi:transcriptional regulator with XRE-family HTH domain
VGKKLSIAEARALGTRIKEARTKARLTLEEAARDIPMHHGQLSRVERGQFKTLSRNVLTLCKTLRIADIPGDATPRSSEALESRFHALLSAVPGSAAAFASLFDVIERTSTRRRRSVGTGKR